MDGLSLGGIFGFCNFVHLWWQCGQGAALWTPERPATISYKTRLEDNAVVTLIKEADLPQVLNLTHRMYQVN